MKVTVLGVLLWIVLTGGALAQEGAAMVSVTGEGQVAVAPDMAVISLGVVHVDQTAGAAMDKVSADVGALMSVLAAQGIAARDIQTSQVSVTPVRDNRADGGRRITGFEARNAVTVRVRDLGGLGGVLDQVLEAGTNTLGGLRFQLQDTGAAQAEARAAAVRDAVAKAEQLSAAAGVTLGPVLAISEGGVGPQPEMFAAAARSVDVPIAAGELIVSVRVSMRFALAP
ncbi:MAG: SIMPL domain-containing protein [Pseudomonadota bacterium]